MTKEIGGYLELEQLVSNEYYKKLIALNTARNALVYILKARNVGKLHIPCFLCDSVSGVCEREGFTFEYYSIDKTFHPIFDKELAEKEYLYIVNYYGQLSNDDIIKYKKKYSNIIVDNVQAFFQEPVIGVDTIYSCRKFFGVPDGAYLATDCILDEELQTDISANRLKHLLGRFECGSASDYYSAFKENDASFLNLDLMYMSKLTHNILGAIDYEKVMKKREDNFNYMHSRLKDKNILNLKIPSGPYAYPFYCKNGKEVRKKLLKNNIYVPTLWPNVLQSGDSLAADYAENILPLPIDQRYIEQELHEIINIIMEEN